MKKRRWTVAAVAVMLLFTGCSFGTLKEQKTGEIEYEIVKKEEIPEKLKEEIAEAEKSEMWISYADTWNEIPLYSKRIRTAGNDRIQHRSE